jgi:hypothetical protein
MNPRFLYRPAYDLQTEVCGTYINICQPASEHVLTLSADLSVGESSTLREFQAGAWHDLNTLVLLCTCVRQRELAQQRTCRTFIETKYYVCVSLRIGYLETCFMQNLYITEHGSLWLYRSLFYYLFVSLNRQGIAVNSPSLFKRNFRYEIQWNCFEQLRR